METNMRNFSFVLEWDDLDEDLRTQKVARYIDHQEANGGYSELNEQDISEDERMSIKVSGAERDISAHFPIYF